MPFFHTFGITVNMMLGLELGAKLVTLPKMDVPAYFKAINDNQVTRIIMSDDLIRSELTVRCTANRASPCSGVIACFDATQGSS